MQVRGSYNRWTLFKTQVGFKADGCSNDYLLNDKATSWEDEKAIDNPPWPHGEFKFSFDGDACWYKNDGKGAGLLHCDAMGAGKNFSCKGDLVQDKNEGLRIKQRYTDLSKAREFRPVAVCEW
jgi:hypothetical protein